MLMLGVADFYHTFGDKQMTVTRISGWHHAIEHVNAAAHRLYDIFRLPYAHQVAGLMLRNFRRRMFDDAYHVFFGLAHRQSANGVTVEANILKTSQRNIAQIFVHAALNNTEQG